LTQEALAFLLKYSPLPHSSNLIPFLRFIQNHNFSMGFLLGVALTALLASSSVNAGSLKDIEHVVIFMQENRAQDTVDLPSFEMQINLPS
jgi:hypothetical protein